MFINNKEEEEIPLVFGAWDEEVKNEHLKIFPLKNGYVRIYDWTGKWFKDFTEVKYLNGDLS